MKQTSKVRQKLSRFFKACSVRQGLSPVLQKTGLFRQAQIQVASASIVIIVYKTEFLVYQN